MDDNIPPPPNELPSISQGIPIEHPKNEKVELRIVSEDEKHYVKYSDIISKLEQGIQEEKLFDEEGNVFVHWKIWHGALGKPKWRIPKCVAKTKQVNRKDQGNLTNASEFLDDADVLDAKMEIIAELIKKAKYRVIYTGAGISRPSGISDYGSRAEGSIANNYIKLKNPCDAYPTYSHHMLTEMERRGFFEKYVQQNHDGLPQKSGFPQHKMNEIHGAWFDPSNPVINFGGKLRKDLVKDMIQIKNAADFVLCMGTSLSGMNADNIVYTPSEKFSKGEKDCFGVGLVNLQFTPVDQIGNISIRVWAKIDDAMKSLAKHLGINNDPKYIFDRNIHPKLTKKNVIVEIPYDENGKLDQSKRMILNLKKGENVVVAHPLSNYAGMEGIVLKDRDMFGNIQIRFTHKTYGKTIIRFGYWWIQDLEKGLVSYSPIINKNPKFKRKNEKQCN